MKVVLFHPVPLPPRDYGGVERVVLWLARGLEERGHEVWVAAHRGSQLPRGVKLIPMESDRSSAWDLLPLLPEGVELVHFMAPPEAGVLEKLPCPGLLTVHGNGKPGEVFPVNTVFLSQDHANRHGAQAYVHNGIDPSEFRFDPKSKRDEFLFLSKTTWKVKNLSGAVRLCSKAGARLAVAGGSRPWSTRLKVSLRPSMRWIGPVSGEKKARALAEAKALVFPILWPEPFGLVVVEALMSGTPVIASRRGSLPELLPPDVGALLDEESEWIDYLGRKSLPWDPERCRAWALERFSYSRMAESYEHVYLRLARGEKLHVTPPVTPSLSQARRNP